MFSTLRSSPSVCLSETNGRNCERAENEEGRREGGSLRKLFVSAAERNCIGNNLSSPASLSLSLSLSPPRISVHASFKFHLRRRRPSEAAVAGNFPWQSPPSLPSHPPSPVRSAPSPLSLSLPLWCQCGDEPKECSTLCGAPISSIKSSGGWHSNSSERERASEAGRQHM